MKEEPGNVDSLLTDLGYNLYQKKAYLALITANQPATVAEIAKLSKVPQPKLYEIMESLEHANLVTSTATRPKQYSLSKVTAMENNIKAEQERLVAHMATLTELSQRISTTPRESEDIRILRGRENVLAYLASMLDKTTKESYDTILPLYHNYPELMGPMRKAIKRGVKLRIMGHTDGQLAIAANYLNMGLQVRLFKGQTIPNPIRLVVGDEKECLFIITGASKNYLTILTNSRPITQSIHTIFKASWNSGLDLQHILQTFAPSTLNKKGAPYTPAQRLLLETIAQCYGSPRSITLPNLSKPFTVYPGTYNPSLSNVAKLLAQTMVVEKGETALAMGGASDYFGLLALTMGAGNVTIQCRGTQEATAAARNVRTYGMENVAVHTGNLFEGLQGRRFDHIIFNAPLLDENPQTPLEATIYDLNRQHLRTFIKQAPSHMTAKGRLQLVYTEKPDSNGENGTALLYRISAENKLKVKSNASLTKHNEAYTAYTITGKPA